MQKLFPALNGLGRLEVSQGKIYRNIHGVLLPEVELP
jgi:hypothetical protein